MTHTVTIRLTLDDAELAVIQRSIAGTDLTFDAALESLATFAAYRELIRRVLKDDTDRATRPTEDARSPHDEAGRRLAEADDALFAAMPRPIDTALAAAIGRMLNAARVYGAVHADRVADMTHDWHHEAAAIIRGDD